MANFGVGSDAPAYLQPACMYRCLADQIQRVNCMICTAGGYGSALRCRPWSGIPRIGIVCFPCQPYSQQRTTGKKSAGGKKRRKTDNSEEEEDQSGPVPAEEHPLFSTLHETLAIMAQRLWDICICEQVKRFGAKLKGSKKNATRSPMDYFVAKAGKIVDHHGCKWYVASRSLSLDSLLFGESGRPRPVSK